MPCAIRRALGYDGSGFTPGTDRTPEGNQMRLTLLGTGNALVTECYNTCFVISDEKNGETRHLLVDGGAATASCASSSSPASTRTTSTRSSSRTSTSTT